MPDRLLIQLDRIDLWGYKGTVEVQVGDRVHYTGVVDSPDIDVVLGFLEEPRNVLRAALAADDGRRRGDDSQPRWSRRQRDTASGYIEHIEETAKSVDEIHPGSIYLTR